MLLNIGVSYRKAPLATLDALTLRDLPGFNKILGSITGVRGAVMVQTCNRVDMFIDADEGVEVNEKILRNWALETKFKLHELRKLVEQRTGDQVLEYLVSLASGLESMLVGESQNPGPNWRWARNSIPRLCRLEARRRISWKFQPCQHTVARNGPDRHDHDESIEGQRDNRCDCCKPNATKD